MPERSLTDEQLRAYEKWVQEKHGIEIGDYDHTRGKGVRITEVTGTISVVYDRYAGFISERSGRFEGGGSPTRVLVYSASQINELRQAGII